MLWKTLALAATFLTAWLVKVTMLAPPDPGPVSGSSRMVYPLRLKVAGLTILAMALGLLGASLTHAIPSSATPAVLWVSGMLGFSGAWMAFESLGTRFEVHEEHLTRVSLLGVKRVRWVEVSRIGMNHNKDAVVLTWSGGRMSVSLRLLNGATFAAAAVKGLPSAVMTASPGAALTIRQLLRSGPAATPPEPKGEASRRTRSRSR
ncbi:hypothetical protein ATI61_109337 [Archangium gephyra]|uniref:PH domain-containing protein n=1 Tax=Archangium gephyra TaxID=48 RepID=A0ABX9JW05_9BACT|nr:hypothetical protein [Archangium gephyra]REG27995.1 hypothetical protein ATI61_109337 [Archangium gephyra]